MFDAAPTAKGTAAAVGVGIDCITLKRVAVGCATAEQRPGIVQDVFEVISGLAGCSHTPKSRLCALINLLIRTTVRCGGNSRQCVRILVDD